MEFFESSRKVVTPIRKGISSLDLTLDKNFDLIDSIHYELISLIGLITENNSLFRNGSQSRLTIGRLFKFRKQEMPSRQQTSAKKDSERYSMFGSNHILVTLRWDDGRSPGHENVCQWLLNRYK